MNGRVVVSKGHMTLIGLLDAIKKIPSRSPFFIHFRIATSGGVRPEMCHPFSISPDMAICHNGIISGIGNALESDTAVLARVMSGLPSASYKKMEILNLINALLQGSRLGILFGNGQSVRLGAWTQQGDLWFSNMIWDSRLSWGSPAAKWYPAPDARGKSGKRKKLRGRVWSKDELIKQREKDRSEKCRECGGRMVGIGAESWCEECGTAKADADTRAADGQDAIFEGLED